MPDAIASHNHKNRGTNIEKRKPLSQEAPSNL